MDSANVDGIIYIYLLIYLFIQYFGPFPAYTGECI